MESAPRQQEEKASGSDSCFSEAARKAVAEYQIVDTPHEKSFDGLCELAIELTGLPMSVISIPDRDRIWFKSKSGINGSESPASISFCSRVVLGGEFFEVGNAIEHPEFASSPLVTGAPFIRHYAGMLLINPDGIVVGALAVFSEQSGQLCSNKIKDLRLLADQVVSLFELGRRKRVSAEQNIQLRASESLRYRIVESSLDHYIELSPAGDVIDVVAAQDELESALNIWSASNWLQCWDPIYQHRIRAALVSVRRGKASHLKAPTLKPDGSRIWWDVALSCESSPGSGNLLAVCRDVTAQVLAEQKVQELNEDLKVELTKRIEEQSNEAARTELLLESLSEGVVACDESGQLVLFNRAAREWHGADPRRIDPSRWSDYYDLRAADGVTPLELEAIPLMRAYGGESVRAVEMSIARRGRPIRVVLASGDPIRDADGKLLGAVIVMHDITEQRQAMQRLTLAHEQLQQEKANLESNVHTRTAELSAANALLARAKEDAEEASRSKSVFLATMSHEIRTPMNGVIGMVDVLKRRDLPGDTRGLVESLGSASDSLLNVIDRILDFSKIESGVLDVKREAYDVAALLERCARSLRGQAMEAGVLLSVHSSHAVPVNALIDGKLCEQIILNLIGNAIKFSAHSEPNGIVNVEASLSHSMPLRLEISVSDNGAGIEPDKLSTLFEPFTQLQEDRSRQYGGSGLGLAISYRLAEAMSGELTVSSDIGLGSIFTLSLPIVAVDGIDESGIPTLQGVSVHVLSSDFAVLERHLNYLRRLGASVCVADRLCEHGRPGCCWLRRVDDVHSLGAEDHCFGPSLFLSDHGPSHSENIAPQACHLGLTAMDRRSLTEGLNRVLSDTTTRDDFVADASTQACEVTDKKVLSESVRVLVVDDDEMNQQVLRYQLEILGYQAVIVADAKTALRRWQQDHFDVLLTDVCMPGMDGYELTQRIRKADSESARRPIIGISANAMRGDAESAREVGMNDYLSKPFTLDQLKAKLDLWLNFSTVDELSPDDSDDPCGELPVLDLSVLKSLVGDNRDVADDMLNAFRLALSGRFTEARMAYRRKDQRRLFSILHRLKSNAMSVGATELAVFCETLEKNPPSGTREWRQSEQRFSSVAKRLAGALQELEGDDNE